MIIYYLLEFTLLIILEERRRWEGEMTTMEGANGISLRRLVVVVVAVGFYLHECYSAATRLMSLYYIHTHLK